MTTVAPAHSWRIAALVWVVARIMIFGIWWFFSLTTQGDVLYYWQRLNLMWTGQRTPAETLIEYPTPVVWLLSLPYGLSRLLAGMWSSAPEASRPVFVVVFIVSLLLLDLLFAVSLWRAGGERRRFALGFWVLFTTLMGPITYMRFDLIPAVLAGWAVLGLLRRRPAGSGVLVGLGAAVKLWPALLWPALLGADRRSQLRASAGFWGVGIALAGVSWGWAGWGRLMSPLTWQSGRGLQVESIWATGVMLVRCLAPEQYQVAISRWQAFEISGAGVGPMLTAANVATVIGIAALVGSYLLWLARAERSVVDAGLLMLLVVLVTIVTNKTFSPQYMIWLGGPLAAVLVAAGQPGAEQQTPSWSQLRAVMIWVLGLTLGTQLVYPILYEPLIHGGPLLPVATAILVARNAAMAWFTVTLARLVWRTLRRTTDSRAHRRREIRGSRP